MNIILLFSIILFYLVPMHAHEARDGDGGLKVGKCYLSYPSGYIIQKKMNDHQYELVGNWMSPNAILNTSKLTPKDVSNLRELGILNLNLKFMGTKSMKMESGFEAPVDLWQECPVDHSTESNSKNSKKDSSVDKNQKPASCQDACFKKDEQKKFRNGETLESCLSKACS